MIYQLNLGENNHGSKKEKNSSKKEKKVNSQNMRTTNKYLIIFKLDSIFSSLTNSYTDLKNLKLEWKNYAIDKAIAIAQLNNLLYNITKYKNGFRGYTNNIENSELLMKILQYKYNILIKRIKTEKLH